jgi:hypothetical protein
MTLLQTRTAETPGAQRVKNDIHARDAIRKPPLRTPRRCGDMPFLQRTRALLQRRTAETPGAQRTLKTTHAWRSVRVRDTRENLPLQTLRRCGDMPFLQRTYG